MALSANSGRDYSHVIRFCIDFQGLLKAVEMYTIEHVAAVDAAVRLQNSFRPLVFENDDVVIMSDAPSLQVGTTFVTEKIIEKTPAIMKIYKLIEERKIGSITIKPDVAPDDLLMMARTLTAPFEPSVAERQYEELDLKTGSRIMISALAMIHKDSDGTILSQLLSGKLDNKLNDTAKDALYNEITRNIESTTRIIQKQLRRELQKEAPVSVRDTLPVACDRWVHILGEVMEKIHSGRDTTSAERQRQILELILPYLSTIQINKRSEEFNTVMEQIESASIQTKIRLFAQYYDQIFQRVEDLATYRRRAQNLVRQLEQIPHAKDSEKSKLVSVAKQEVASVAPGAVNFPAVFGKVMFRVLQTREPELIQPMLFIALDRLSDTASVPSGTVDEFASLAISFCKEFNDYCESTVTGFIKILSDTPVENQPEILVQIMRKILEEYCDNCRKINKCAIVETLSSELCRQTISQPLATAFIELWQRTGHAVLKQDFNAFLTRIVPLAENDLAPDRFSEDGLQDCIAEAWKSFADAPYFKNLFKRLTGPEKKIRFDTIDYVSRFGSFAVWLSLGGLGNQNWQLRRNLATIIGRVAPLDKPAFLKQVLRDRDWHVRFEVISALRHRIEEVADQIKSNNEHPLGRIITLALLDGRKEIREETYAIFESITPPDAVRGLINAYERLSSVSDDYEVEERCRIIALLGIIAQNNPEHFGEVIDFVSRIATLKEGLLTPQWMISLKKTSVECLEKISSAESRHWIETLARKRPYKRGVVGREARAALKRIGPATG
jgi:hypothetical protein